MNQLNKVQRDPRFCVSLKTIFKKRNKLMDLVRGLKLQLNLIQGMIASWTYKIKFLILVLKITQTRFLYFIFKVVQ